MRAPLDALPTIALVAVQEGWDSDEDAPLLLAALTEAGALAGPAMWDDASVDWSAFDLVVVRSTWDYAERPEEFVAWARSVETATTLANPADVIEWNIDKHYLGALADRGVAVVPTVFLEPSAGDDAVSAVLRAHAELVVKPTVSAGSKDTSRYTSDQVAVAAEHVRRLLDAGRPVMVQPYLSSVDRVGETGMVFLDGGFSHAFRKGQLLRTNAAPVDGLFALENISPRTPDDDELELAAQVLDTASQLLDTGTLLYARVDVIRDESDRPVLLELELTEPSFFLASAPGAAARAAEAMVAAARVARAARTGPAPG